MRAILASDLSSASGKAIRNDDVLAALQDAGVEAVDLVTVVDSKEKVPGMDVADKHRVALERSESKLEEAGFDVSIHVRHGVPHRRINDVTEEVDADLVVIGSSGHDESKPRFLGSTARDIARTTIRPLLVVRLHGGNGGIEPIAPQLFEHVLYATDFSETADRALDVLRGVEGAVEDITLAHVTAEEKDRDEASERLADLAETLDGASTTVRVGEPAPELREAATEIGASLILVGSRGQGRLRRLLLGSVSDRVVAEGEQNALVVPPADRN